MLLTIELAIRLLPRVFDEQNYSIAFKTYCFKNFKRISEQRMTTNSQQQEIINLLSAMRKPIRPRPGYEGDAHVLERLISLFNIFLN